MGTHPSRCSRARWLTKCQKQGWAASQSSVFCPLDANRDQKKAGVALLISDKIDFKTKAVKRDKEGHYIMIKGSIQEEDITIINIYALNAGAPQYVR